MTDSALFAQTAGIWSGLRLNTEAHSAIGARLWLPEHWTISTHANKIFGAPGPVQATPFAPFQFFTVPVLERGLRRLERRFCATLRSAGARILHKQLLGRPRPALMIDYELLLPEGLVRSRMIGELIDDETLCACVACSDWACAGDGALTGAGDIWRAAQLAPCSLPHGCRRIVHELAGVQFACPLGWQIDLSGNTLIVLRHPARERSNPNLTVQCDVDERRARSLREMTERFPARAQPWQPLRIGNRSGLGAAYTHHDRHGRRELVRELLPEPTERAALFIQLSGAECDEHLLNQLQGAFRWMPGV